LTYKINEEMYAEVCAETGVRGSKEGFEAFVAWRKRVEAFFDKNRKENA